MSTVVTQQKQFPILHIKNLPYKYTHSDLFALLGQFGNIQEIRVGNSSDNETRGQAFVVYTTLKATLLAQEKLSGFNYHGRYLVVKPYMPEPHIIKELASTAQA